MQGTTLDSSYSVAVGKEIGYDRLLQLHSSWSVSRESGFICPVSLPDILVCALRVSQCRSVSTLS